MKSDATLHPQSNIMEIVNVKIADLVMADYNPRQWSERDREDLKASLSKFGFVDPVIVNSIKKRKNVVVGGHFRTAMWKELGHDTVPCVFLKLTLEQEKELNIRLNKNTGSFDYKLLEEHFAVEDLLSFGFEEHEFGILATAPTLDLDGDGAPAPQLPNAPPADTAMVQLFFNVGSKAEFMEHITFLSKHYGTDNITDTAHRAIQDARATAEKAAH